MIDGHTVTAIIPARGGSKSIKRKNLQNLGNKPLLVWPIESSLKSSEIDRTIVSTDDDEIAEVAKQNGAEVYFRPEYLAKDDSVVIDTIKHLYSQLRSEGDIADIFLLLEPTSPFRSADLIRKCLTKLIKGSYDSLATFHLADIHPDRVWKIHNDIPTPYIEGSVAWKPRQALAPAYQLNGAVYVFFPNRLPRHGISLLFGKFGAEIIDHDQVVDIDTKQDLEIANAILKT
jgi:CMP-N,N'-diacetyllegionaminic acid synthase